MQAEGFDWAWSVLPQISSYQLVISIIAGYTAFVGGMTAVCRCLVRQSQIQGLVLIAR